LHTVVASQLFMTFATSRSISLHVRQTRVGIIDMLVVSLERGGVAI